MTEITVLSAFLVGLLGGTHCVGMCGGIMAALSMQIRAPGTAPFRMVLAYNLGRISTYTIAGMLAGLLGAVSTHLLALHQAQLWLQALAALFMLLLGLYLGGWWPVLQGLERLGGHVWRFIEPLSRRWIPIRSVPQAYVVGLVWGWLPCGMVYTVLVYSFTAGGMWQGGLQMLAFGVGTLPVMLALGVAGVRLRTWLQQVWVRRAAGALLIGFALWMALQTVYGWMSATPSSN